VWRCRRFLLFNAYSVTTYALAVPLIAVEFHVLDCFPSGLTSSGKVTLCLSCRTDGAFVRPASAFWLAWRLRREHWEHGVEA